MPWINRGKHDCFYHCRRVDGQPVTFAFGHGEAAEFAARQVEQQRSERAADKAARVMADAATALIKQFHDRVEQLIRGTLILNGYHRHDRGEWRKRRE